MNKQLLLIFSFCLPVLGWAEVQCQTRFETSPGIGPGYYGFENHFIAYGPTFEEACAKATQNCEKELKRIPPQKLDKGIHCQTGYCIFVLKEKRGPVGKKIWGGESFPINSFWAHLDDSNKNVKICPALEFCKKAQKKPWHFCEPYGDYKKPDFKGQ